MTTAPARTGFAPVAAVMVAAQAVFCLNDGFVKAITAEVSAIQYGVLRAGFIFVFLCIGALIFTGMRARPVKLLPVLARSGFQACSMLLQIFALSLLPLSTAAVCFYTFPLFSTLLSALVMRERVSRMQVGAVVLGLLGAVLIIGPARAEGLALVLPFAAAFCYAASVLVTHYHCKEEQPVALVRTQALVALCVAGVALAVVPAAAGGTWVSMPLELWGAVALVGVASIGSGFLLVWVYQRAAPPDLAPFSYTYLLWVMLLDFAAWGHLPRPAALLGSVLIALGGIMVLREGRKLTRRFNQPLR
ncbi:DMT family transporter [Oceanicella sp. SM1341]|uniref:DMT family transporter n=1 Tax=Oceanicella sp. SM1341 TaxID=1548889 RepID=UPI000E484201|nr:DMT family transporter [Oceanicella sp. SM1341]